MSTPAVTNCFLPTAQLTTVLRELVNDSFFLAQDVKKLLESDGWTIHPIQVVTNDEFWQGYPALLEKNPDHVVFLPSYRLVDMAKMIGVSVRQRRYEMIVIIKVWYNDRKAANDKC